MSQIPPPAPPQHPYPPFAHYQPNPYAEASSKKIAAGICALLLGGLGVHKFILGYTSTGVLTLVIFLVGGLLTCGIACSVMHIIGLVEGIIYLTKSDEEFHRTYIADRKQWF